MKYKILLLTVALQAFSTNATATSRSWDNDGGDNNFSNALNWQFDGIPHDGWGLDFADPDLAGTINNDLNILDSAFYFIADGYTITGNDILGDSAGVLLSLNTNISATFETNFDLNGQGLYMALDPNSLLTINGDIVDGSDLTIFGGGSVALNGDNDLSGAISITDSTVLLGDNEHHTITNASSVDVTNGNLTAFGTINSDVNMVNSTFSAGSAGNYANVTINGNYTQDANSTLNLYFHPGNGPALDINGLMTMQADFNLIFDPRAAYTEGSYIVVLADSWVNSGVTHGTSPSIPGYVTHSTVGSPGSPNITTTFRAKPLEMTGSNPVYSDNNIFMQNAAYNNLGSIFNHIDGVAENGITQQADIGNLQFASLTDSELQTDGFANLAPASGLNADTGAWVHAIGSLGSRSANNGAAGYDSNTVGMIGGLEKWLSDDVLAGVSASYANSDIEQNNVVLNRSDIDSVRASVYGLYQFSYADLSAIAGYGYNQIDAKREVALGGAIANSSYNIYDWNAAVQAAHTITAGGIEITPKAGVQYSNLNQEGFKEKDAGLLNITVHHNSTESLQPFVGFNISGDMETEDGMKFIPEARIKYRYETLETSSGIDHHLHTVISDGGRINGFSSSRNIVEVGGSLNITTGYDFNLLLDYNANIYTGSGYDQTVMLGGKYKF